MTPCTAGLLPQIPRHFPRLRSAPVSQTLQFCYLSDITEATRIPAPPPLCLQKHTDLCSLFQLVSLGSQTSRTCAQSWRLCWLNPAIQYKTLGELLSYIIRVFQEEGFESPDMLCTLVYRCTSFGGDACSCLQGANRIKNAVLLRYESGIHLQCRGYPEGGCS